jgi:tape measure domain-containing protein
VALNIGAINFGVDAQTQGLQKAITQLQAFQKVVNQTARSQQQGAQATANALGRQESAIKRAFQQTLNLRRAMQQAGSGANDLAKVSTAFRTLTKEMTSGELSAIQFSRAIDAFNARLNRSSRALKDMQAAARRKEVSQLTELFRELESSAVLAVGPLSGLGSRLRALGAIATRTNLSIAALIATTAGVVVGFAAMATGAVQATASLERMTARFMFANRSWSKTTEEMGFIIGLSKRLGLNLISTGEAYSRLTAATNGTRLAGEQTRNIFIGVSEAVAAMKLDGQAAEGTFRAIEQMLSKGSVAAEELRGQLGERLLGAFNLAAKAMGVTTEELNKMLKTGEVTAEEFLPKFVKVLHDLSKGFADQNVNTFAGALNGLKNASTIFLVQFDQMFRITDRVIGAINALTRFVEFMTKHMHLFAKAAAAAAGALAAMAAASIIRSVVSLAGALGSAAKMAVLFNRALLANPMGAVAKGAVILTGALIGMEAMDRLLGDINTEVAALNSQFKDLPDPSKGIANLTDEYDKVLEKIKDVQRNIRDQKSLLGATEAGDVSPFRVDALMKAQELIDALNKDEMVALKKHLQDITGQDFTTVLGPLADMFELTKQLDDEFDDLKRRIEATPEGLHNFGVEMVRTLELLDALKKGPRALELFNQTEDIARNMEHMRDALLKLNLADDVRNQMLSDYLGVLQQVAYAQDNLNTLSADWASTMTRHLEDIIFHAGSLREVVRSLIQDMVRLVVRAAILAPLEKGLSGWFGGWFGGFRAEGGPVSAGKSYVVGENGPEMFTPTRSGYVAANGAGGGDVYLNYTIDARGADSSLIKRLPGILEQTRRQTRAEVKQQILRRQF